VKQSTDQTDIVKSMRLTQALMRILFRQLVWVESKKAKWD